MNAREIINEAIDPKWVLRHLRPRSVVKLRLRRKSSTEEWVVRVWVDGRYSEDATYYTDDKEDAQATMAAMASQFQAQGCSVI
jgi:hypothetical protein